MKIELWFELTVFSMALATAVSTGIWKSYNIVKQL